MCGWVRSACKRGSSLCSCVVMILVRSDTRLDNEHCDADGGGTGVAGASAEACGNGLAGTIAASSRALISDRRLDVLPSVSRCATGHHSIEMDAFEPDSSVLRKPTPSLLILVRQAASTASVSYTCLP